MRNLVKKLHDAAIEYEGSRIQGLLCQAGDELLAATIENEKLKKLALCSVNRDLDMLENSTRPAAEPNNSTQTEVKMNAKIVRAGWFNLLVYRLFYLCWNKILYVRPDLWDKIRGTPSQPLYVHGEMRKIIDGRFGRCAGCEWHPDVCNHCIRSFDEDFDVPPNSPLASSCNQNTESPTDISD